MADIDSASELGKGHRERLRQRLLSQGGDALSDHELIEYLLALAIPRKDTKPLAKALIEEHGGFGRLLSADGEALARRPGLGETSAAALKIVQAAALRLIREPLRDTPVLGSWQAVIDYLTADMAHLTIERVRVLHLNAKNMLIRDELLSEGSLDEAMVPVREVIRSALDVGAAALILVHNHPSGDPAPSRADIALTREIIEAGKRLNIAVHDHIVVGTKGHASMRALGLI